MRTAWIIVIKCVDIRVSCCDSSGEEGFQTDRQSINHDFLIADAPIDARRSDDIIVDLSKRGM